MSEWERLFLEYFE
jgi:preprotein translocase subunit SecA